eukprot:12413788-Karenia_brevis.AAC.1
MPTPILNKMSALSAARKSSMSAKGVATALLFECASCAESGCLSSQVRVHNVDGQELYQCQRCYIELECDGQEITATCCRNIVGKSKNFAHYVGKNSLTLGANGGRGGHA